MIPHMNGINALTNETSEGSLTPSASEDSVRRKQQKKEMLGNQKQGR